jgi:ribosomal protein S20
MSDTSNTAPVANSTTTSASSPSSSGDKPSSQEVKIIDKNQLQTALSLVYNAIDTATQKGAFNLDNASKIKSAFDYIALSSDSLEKCQQYVINDLAQKQVSQGGQSQLGSVPDNIVNDTTTDIIV